MILEEIVNKLALLMKTAPYLLEERQPLLTLLSHPNMAAVVSLLGLAGIMVTGGMELNPGTKEKVEEEGLRILTTEHSTYTIVSRLVQLGVAGTG